MERHLIILNYRFRLYVNKSGLQIFLNVSTDYVMTYLQVFLLKSKHVKSNMNITETSCYLSKNYKNKEAIMCHTLIS